jgi:hypothetical protein
MSSTRQEILASAAQTATAQGSGIAVGNLKELGLAVEVTNVSASLSAVYLQGSSDGGTTWYDLLCDSFVNLTSGASTGTTGSYARNVVADLTTGAVQKAFASYGKTTAFGDFVRLAWVIAGSGPSCTFSARIIGKN